MNLKQLVGKKLYDAIVEIRENSENYEEVVLLKKNLPSWKRALTIKLGTPLITDEELEIVNSSEDVLKSRIELALEAADPFGGIAEGQTLYYGVYDSTVILILIWPWQDNVNVTLKKAIL